MVPLREDLNWKKTFSLGHCPNNGGGGLPMPEFFGPLFRSAFLVNKKKKKKRFFFIEAFPKWQDFPHFKFYLSSGEKSHHLSRRKSHHLTNWFLQNLFHLHFLYRNSKHLANILPVQYYYPLGARSWLRVSRSTLRPGRLWLGDFKANIKCSIPKPQVRDWFDKKSSEVVPADEHDS